MSELGELRPQIWGLELPLSGRKAVIGDMVRDVRDEQLGVKIEISPISGFSRYCAPRGKFTVSKM